MSSASRATRLSSYARACTCVLFTNFAVAFLIACSARNLSAQQAGPRDPNTGAASGPVASDIITRDGVTTNGLPRSYIVVTVPVPEDISAQRPVEYEIAALGGFNIVGR